MFDLKQAREALNISQEEVAQAAGVSRGTVSKWESGDIANMKRDKIAKIAALLHVSPLAILGIEQHDNSDLPIHSYRYIPAAISAGKPAEVDPISEDQVEVMDIPDAVMGKWAGHSDVTLMRANGESMNRVIPDGSLIGVHSIDDPSDLKDGDIVVFDCDGEYAVKRFYNDPQHRQYIFQPDSTRASYLPIVYAYDSDELVHIVGKVVMYTVELS